MISRNIQFSKEDLQRIYDAATLSCTDMDTWIHDVALRVATNQLEDLACIQPPVRKKEPMSELEECLEKDWGTTKPRKIEASSLERQNYMGIEVAHTHVGRVLVTITTPKHQHCNEHLWSVYNPLGPNQYHSGVAGSFEAALEAVNQHVEKEKFSVLYYPGPESGYPVNWEIYDVDALIVCSGLGRSQEDAEQAVAQNLDRLTKGPQEPPKDGEKPCTPSPWETNQSR